jgi:hypothetical protein
MIFHASIPAHDPQRVATVIAEIWGGEAFRFPPWPGGWVAVAGDERGSILEVYPRNQVMAPGEGDAMVRTVTDEAPRPYSCVHLAVATRLGLEQVLAIGAREGWRAVRCTRSVAFDVIELWIENSLMLEVLTVEMQRDYQAGVNLDTFRFTRQQQPEPALA